MTVASGVSVDWRTGLRDPAIPAMRLRVEDVDEAGVRETAAQAGRRVVLLDTVDAVSAADVITAFAEQFDFDLDEAADRDWDFVDDNLSDFDVNPATGLIVVWTGWESVAEEDEHVLATAVDSLVTAARYWTDDGVPWTVLVAGDGPSCDLPWAGSGAPPWEVGDDEDAPDDLENGDALTDLDEPGYR